MTAERVVRSHPDGAMLTVWVVPGARRTEVVGFHGEALRVRVAASPEKGMANKAVIALLETALGMRLRLVGGAGSRRKRLVAVGADVAELIAAVESVAN